MKATIAYSLAASAALSALGGCGGSDPVENKAEQLEEAAEQSDPAAAQVLENTADQVLEQNSVAPARDVMDEAGNASAGQRLKQGPASTPAERAPPLPKDGPIEPSEIR